MISDWKQGNYTVLNQPTTFVRYLIKVEAQNDLGNSTAKAKEIFGYSGEISPTKAPTNFEVNISEKPGSVLLQWNSVSDESLNGQFNFYAIQTWCFLNNEKQFREFHRGYYRELNETEVTGLYPNVIHYFRIFVHNKHHRGPGSDVINITLNVGIPSQVQNFQAFPLGSRSFLLRWNPPLFHNHLTKYRVGGACTIHYYRALDAVYIEPNVNQTKLSGLKSSSVYRLCIVATSSAGSGPR